METKKDPTAESASKPNEPKPSAEAAREAPVDEAPALASAVGSEASHGEPAVEPAPPAKRRRGFAAMDRAKVRELARRGGAAAHAKGTAHRFTPEEAREAGRRGGSAPHRTRGTRGEAAST
jgi:general stress protein YciG